MSDQIIGLHEWFETPPGQYLLDWERRCFEEGVADIFGYHSLQLGLPVLDTLAANRMPHQWLALGEDGLAVLPGARPAGQAPASTLPGTAAG